MRSTQRTSPAPAEEPKARTTVVQRIVDAVTSGIFSGLYAPGQRLVEADLTRELGVSRNALREALGRMAADGLLQIEPYRGAIVARPSRREVMEMLDVRATLEAMAAVRAAERIGEPGLRDHALAVAGPLLETREVQPNAEDYLAENGQFHDLILELSGNHCLPGLIHQLQLPVFQAAFFRIYDRSLYEQSARDHRQIFAAILDGDAAAAERAVRAHVERTINVVRSLPDYLFRQS